MSTWEERMTPRPPREPLLERASIVFRMQGLSKRPIRCALYIVDTGHELRLEYENDNDDELLQSQLFRTNDANAIATLADKWHRMLAAKGFEELAVE